MDPEAWRREKGHPEKGPFLPKGAGLSSGWACGTDMRRKAQATQCELLLPGMESTVLAVGSDRGTETHSCSPPVVCSQAPHDSGSLNATKARLS